MQSINTKFLPITDTHINHRVKATTSSGVSIIVTRLDVDEEDKALCIRAAKELCNKLSWHGMYHGGETKQGFIFVAVDEKLAFYAGGK